jgi:7-cyano-7-deazaguanine synthase
MADHTPTADPPVPLAVLVSGGLDSAILLAESARQRPAVHPLYVRFGLYWEEVELAHLRRFLEAIAAPSLRPLTVLDMPVADLYGPHWSITGRGVPGPRTPDEAVFLPGRNLFFLAKALVWCHLHQVPEAALAPLEQNPFPDATPAFFRACQDVVNQAVGGRVQVLFPFLGLSKVEVLRRGAGLPLGWTFSCIRPADGRHCGACNKCQERRVAFRAAGLSDPTEYERCSA